MAVEYLENHTVRITSELWDFVKTFNPDESTVPMILNPVYHTIKFVGIPSEISTTALVKCERLDRTHVKETVDLYFTNHVKKGRSYGFRSWNIADTENPDGYMDTKGMFFDSKGHVMVNSNVILSAEQRSESADISQYVLYAFLFVNQLLAVGSDNLIEDDLPIKEMRKRSHKPKKGSRGDKTIATTRLGKTYRIKPGFDFSERNPIVRTCRLWIVRGHDRKYSNGKVIHIDPYYKGVDRKFGSDPSKDVDNFGRKIIVNSSVLNEEVIHVD